VRWAPGSGPTTRPRPETPATVRCGTDGSSAEARFEEGSAPDLDWTVTDDPEAALAAAEAGEVDCPVTALDLPDRTEVEVAEAARDRDDVGFLPVVLFADGDAGGERVAAVVSSSKEARSSAPASVNGVSVNVA
jgi:CheY-like chemotaxis protein